MNVPAPSSPASAPVSGIGATDGAKRYRVFLSYSHADTKWARWVMRRLEGWRVPKRLHGRMAPIGEVGARIAPVFRDRDELPTTSDLGESIRAALRESATLVVICSPAAAKSRWVREEIVAFKRLHGERRVFGFIVSGEPKVEGTDEDCFSPALRAEIGADGELSARPAEIVAADARVTGDGKEVALVRLLAGLLGVGFDELRQREQARRLRRMTWIAAGSAVGMAVMFGLAVAAWRARNDAQRRQANADDLLTFMLGDLRDELKKIGRLSVLDAVGAKAMAYFDSLDVRDASDTALARQATALTQIGQNRLDQVRYAEASVAFATAYERAAALVKRNPANKDMWFERGRAEHWLGYTDLQRRELVSAGRWFARYRDTARGLWELDRADARSRHEVAYAQQSLAVLKVELGDYADARASFVAEREMLERLSAAKPSDLQVRFELSVNDSWLGVTAERRGEYAEAVEHFGRAAGTMEAVIAEEPGTAFWRFECADRYSHQGIVLGCTGRHAESRRALHRAQELIGPLAANDPQNRNASARVAAAGIVQAASALAESDWTEAARLLEASRRRLEPIVADEPTSPTNANFLVRAWRIEALLRLAQGRTDAGEAAARAIVLVQPFLTKETAGDRIVRTESAEAYLVAGLVADRAGNEEAARQHWQQSLDLLDPDWLNSCHWRLLDPAARALILLKRYDEGRSLIDRLNRLGYRPLSPWPEPAAHFPAPSNLNPQK